jgi:hypothetical protein
MRIMVASTYFMIFLYALFTPCSTDTNIVLLFKPMEVQVSHVKAAPHTTNLHILEKPYIWYKLKFGK